MRDLQAARGTAIARSRTAVTEPNRRRLRRIFATVALVGLAADVSTKTIAVAQLDPQAPVPLLGGLLTLRLIRNPGAAFSQGEQFTAVIACFAIAVLGFVLVRLVPRIGHVGWAVALGLLCAGVAGNLSDRLFRAPGVLRGHVVDFLQLPHWPIFNVADICIDAAAVFIVVLAVVKNVGVDGQAAGRSSASAPTAEGKSPNAPAVAEPDRHPDS